MSSEISGYKRAIRKSQDDGENLTLVSNKLENEIDYIKRQIEDLNDEKEKLGERFSVYSKSLEQADKEMNRFQQEKAVVTMEISANQKAMVTNFQATQKLERDVAEKLQMQFSLEKGAKGSQRDGQKLRSSIHEKEFLLATVDNELSKVQLDILNSQGRIKTMRETISKIDEDLNQKNLLTEKYEVEIRRCNDELGKKASEIDTLNKKYEQVTGGNENGHMGTLEATIYNMTKSIQQKEQECFELQKFWLRAQNEMVQMSTNSNEITDETQNLRLRLTVLNRKKMVVNNAFKSEEMESKEHSRNIRQLQNDMVKVNKTLSKQSGVFGQLEESNLELEQMFRARLKEAEIQSIQMETNLDELKAEKEQALTGLVEAE